MYGREKNGRFKTGYEPTPAQRWQRKRFACKGSVTSMQHNIESMLKVRITKVPLIPAERENLEEIKTKLLHIITRWKAHDGMSKMLFLEKELL